MLACPLYTAQDSLYNDKDNWSVRLKKSAEQAYTIKLMVGSSKAIIKPSNIPQAHGSCKHLYEKKQYAMASQ